MSAATHTIGNQVSGPSKTYTLPDRELDAIRDLGMTFDEARTSRDGYFSSWIERYRTERYGHPVITLQERGQGWAVEVTLDEHGAVTEAVALPPEKARELDR